MTKEKTKKYTLFALSGLFSKGPKPNVKIDTQPLSPKHDLSLISKQKLNKMKGKKARKNRGNKRGK